MTALAGLSEPLSAGVSDEAHLLGEKSSPPRNIDGSFAADDSEAETERLHDSPAKKRMAAEPAPSPTKRTKLSRRGPGGARSPGLANGLKMDAGEADAAETDAAGEEDATEPTETEKAADDSEASSGEAAANESDANTDNEENEDEDSDRESNEERIRAIKALSEIEVDFAQARDSLHDQQIAKYDLEIEMCAEGVHPELKQYETQIQEERDARLERTRNLLKFQMNAISNHSRSGRCAVYQTYLKNKFAVHSSLLNEVTQKWYQINFERRKQASAAPDFGYVATSKPCRIQRPTPQSIGITQHKSLLNMPLAPSMYQATDSEREDDLRDLGLR